MPRATRRQVLASLGAVLTGSVATSGTATAAVPGQPDTVTIDYPENRLQAYQPRLVTRTLEVQPEGWYAWRATSPEYDGQWLCYWAYYPAQVGVSGADSHVPDREPVYIRVADGGEIDRVVYDRVHYLVGTAVPPRTDRVRLRAVNPWHNYTPTTTEGELLSVSDLRNRYEDWLTTGWSVAERTVADPPTVLARGHWWPESSTFGISTQAWLAELAAASDSEFIGTLLGGT